MILSDADIKHRCIYDDLILPFDEDQVQPASYDCRLSGTFRVFDNPRVKVVDLGDPSTYRDLTREHRVPQDEEFVLHPGEFVLGSTDEVVNNPVDLTARIEGKSSLGRLGLVIHSTAGYIDPGFNGSVTLEMTNLLRVPIVLRPGMLIAQLSFHLMNSVPEKPYEGRYQGDKTTAPSRYGMDKKGRKD